MKFNGDRKILLPCPLHRDQHGGVRSQWSICSQRIPSLIVRPIKKECIMTNLRLIGAAALSLILAGPAMADGGGYGMHDEYHGLYRHHQLPAQDAINFGYGNAYPTYHSGWGGLYGDGNYPGTVDDNMGPAYRDR
jgi:hypothetical protein